MSETNTELMFNQAANSNEYTGLKDHLGEIKSKLLCTYNPPSKEFIVSSFKFLESLKEKNISYEKDKLNVTSESKIKLDNLKDEFDIYSEIQLKLGEIGRIRIKERDEDHGDDFDIKNYLITKRNHDGSFEFNIKSIKRIRDENFTEENLGTSVTFTDLKDMDKYLVSAKKPIVKVEEIAVVAKGESEKPKKEEIKESTRINFVDSKYETEKFNNKDISYIINYVSDRNTDGKVETLNELDRKWYYLWMGGDKVQGQNISETFLKDSLSEKFKSREDFNKLLKHLGVNEITDKTTEKELKTIKETFYSRLIEKMTKMGKNGKLDGYYSILDGTESERKFVKDELIYEEKLEKDIDKLLNSKETEENIKKRLGELKEKYGLPKAENAGDLQRIKDLLKGTLIQNSEINFGIFGGAISSNGDKPKGGDIIGQIINGLDMKDYKGILGFYISKKVYQSSDKAAVVNIGIANFIPYVSANYAMTAKDMNKDKIATIGEVDGNITVVPGVSLSLLSVGVHAELNWNDKNRAIEKEIVKTQDLLNNILIDPKTNSLAIDRKAIMEKYNPNGDIKIKSQIELMLKSFENYFNEFKTGDINLDKRLLQKLKNSTVTYFTNEIYNKNEGLNLSGITIGIILSLFNFGTWASFLGINFQARSQRYKDSEDGASAEQIAVASADIKETTFENLKSVGFEKTVYKNHNVLKYTGKIKNFYAPKEIQIEKSKDGQIYISGDIKQFFFVDDATNLSHESYILVNGAKYGDNSFSKTIDKDIVGPTKTVEEEIIGKPIEIDGGIETFDDKEKLKVMCNSISNNDRYKTSFKKFQKLVADIYLTGNIDNAWDQLGKFINEPIVGITKNEPLNLREKKIIRGQFIDYFKSINPNDSKTKEFIMLNILGNTAGDWRVRFFNELHGTSKWAVSNRRKLGLKANFKMEDLKDGKDNVINHPKKAELKNLEESFDNTSADYYSKKQTEYDTKNNVQKQKDIKNTKTEPNAIVFVNFTQKDGSGRKAFHDIVPIYGNVEIHDGKPEDMNDAPNKLEYVDIIPDRVLISKFDSIKSKIKNSPQKNKNYDELVQKLDLITTDEEKIKIIKDSLKGEKNDIGLKGTFNLSFVRWSTCQNAAYMISNMEFSIDIPGYKSSKIIPGLPQVGQGSFYRPAVTANNVSNIVIGGSVAEGNFQNNKKPGEGTTVLEGNGSTGTGTGGTGTGTTTGTGR